MRERNFINRETARGSGKEKLPENVVIIDRPEAKYRIIYEKHDLPHDPEEIGKPDALALERVSLGAKLDEKGIAELVVGMHFGNKLSKIQDNSGGEREPAIREIRHIIENNIPLYLVDVGDPKGILDKKSLRADILKLLQGVGGGIAGIHALGQAVEKKIGGKAMGRRDFLKIAGLGSIGMWGGMQLLDALISMREEGPSSTHTQLSSGAKEFRKIQELVHPETEAVYFALRNIVWAEKLEDAANNLWKALGRKPEVAITVGTLHSGLEDIIKESRDKRLRALKKILNFYGFKSGEISLSPMVRLEFSPKERRFVVKEITKSAGLEKIEKEL